MTSSEKNTHRKIRISIIDVLIVLAVIAGIGGTIVHYRLYEKNNAVVTDYTAEISILLSSLDSESAERLTAGEKVYYEDKTCMGVITRAEVEEAVIYFTDGEGKIQEGRDENLKDVRLTVEVKGEFTDGGFLALGRDYTAAGMEIEFFTPDFSGKGLIFDVKNLSE